MNYILILKQIVGMEEHGIIDFLILIMEGLIMKYRYKVI